MSNQELPQGRRKAFSVGIKRVISPLRGLCGTSRNKLEHVPHSWYGTRNKSLLYRSEVKKIRTPADANLRADPPSVPPPQESPSNPDDKKPVELAKGREGDGVVTIGFDPPKMIGR